MSGYISSHPPDEFLPSIASTLRTKLDDSGPWSYIDLHVAHLGGREMVEAMSQLYGTLQLLKKPWHKDSRERWYVQSGLHGEWDGPFEAAEVAYQIFVGLLGPHDRVINGQTNRRYIVNQHRFLNQWMTSSKGRARRLMKALDRAVRERAELNNLSLPSMPRWFAETMSDEELRAFRVLDLDPVSSRDDVRRRHRELALANHPDRGGDLTRMKEINWAFNVASRALPAQA